MLHSIIMGKSHPLVILHGLFGSGRNWFSPGKILSSDFEAHLLDLRNHGKSFHSDEWDYKVMSQDVFNYFEAHQINKAVLIGHSMGGKVAMNVAAHYPTKISHLIIVDIGPGFYPTSPQHLQILNALKSLDLSQIHSRKQADEILSENIPDRMIRQFLLTNLYRNENRQFDWRCNFKVIHQKMTEVGQDISDSFHKGSYFDKAPVLFIKGEKSDYLPFNQKQTENIKRLFPRAQLSSIPDAGHWVHIDQPDLFLERVKHFIKNN